MVTLHHAIAKLHLVALTCQFIETLNITHKGSGSKNNYKDCHSSRLPFFMYVRAFLRYVENPEMDNSPKWVFFIKVSGQITGDTLWK